MVTKHLPDGTSVQMTDEEARAEMDALRKRFEPVRPSGPRYSISKFKLITKIQAAGKADLFFEFIDQLPRVQNELWYAAQTLDSDNSLILGMIPSLSMKFNMSTEEVDALLKSAKA